MMILRWTAAGVREAERHFRKVALSSDTEARRALRAQDAAIESADVPGVCIQLLAEHTKN